MADPYFQYEASGPWCAESIEKRKRDREFGVLDDEEGPGMKKVLTNDLVLEMDDNNADIIVHECPPPPTSTTRLCDLSEEPFCIIFDCLSCITSGKCMDLGLIAFIRLKMVGNMRLAMLVNTSFNKFRFTFEECNVPEKRHVDITSEISLHGYSRGDNDDPNNIHDFMLRHDDKGKSSESKKRNILADISSVDRAFKFNPTVNWYKSFVDLSHCTSLRVIEFFIPSFIEGKSVMKIYTHNLISCIIQSVMESCPSNLVAFRIVSSLSLNSEVRSVILPGYSALKQFLSRVRKLEVFDVDTAGASIGLNPSKPIPFGVINLLRENIGKGGDNRSHSTTPTTQLATLDTQSNSQVLSLAHFRSHSICDALSILLDIADDRKQKSSIHSYSLTFGSESVNKVDNDANIDHISSICEIISSSSNIFDIRSIYIAQQPEYVEFSMIFFEYSFHHLTHLHITDMTFSVYANRLPRSLQYLYVDNIDDYDAASVLGKIALDFPPQLTHITTTPYILTRSTHWIEQSDVRSGFHLPLPPSLTSFKSTYESYRMHILSYSNSTSKQDDEQHFDQFSKWFNNGHFAYDVAGSRRISLFGARHFTESSFIDDVKHQDGRTFLPHDLPLSSPLDLNHFYSLPHLTNIDISCVSWLTHNVHVQQRTLDLSIFGGLFSLKRLRLTIAKLIFSTNMLELKLDEILPPHLDEFDLTINAGCVAQNNTALPQPCSWDIDYQGNGRSPNLKILKLDFNNFYYSLQLDIAHSFMQSVHRMDLVQIIVRYVPSIESSSVQIGTGNVVILDETSACCAGCTHSSSQCINRCLLTFNASHWNNDRKSQEHDTDRKKDVIRYSTATPMLKKDVIVRLFYSLTSRISPLL